MENKRTVSERLDSMFTPPKPIEYPEDIIKIRVDIHKEMNILNKREDLYLKKSNRISDDHRCMLFFYSYFDGLGRHFKTFVL